MIETKYLPETDSLLVKIGEVEEVVDFKEFMDGVGAQRARLENLLVTIDQIKKERITKTGVFIGIVEGIMKKQEEIRKKMEDATDNEDYKQVASLQKVHKALLDEKNTFREIRYAIKLLDTDEARVRTELLELIT